MSLISFDDSIYVLDLDTRALHCLENLGVRTIGELVQIPISRLRAARNFGVKSIQKLEDVLMARGLRLEMPLEELRESACAKVPSLDFKIAESTIERALRRMAAAHDDNMGNFKPTVDEAEELLRSHLDGFLSNVRAGKAREAEFSAASLMFVTVRLLTVASNPEKA
jgi:hypothetical protein